MLQESREKKFGKGIPVNALPMLPLASNAEPVLPVTLSPTGAWRQCQRLLEPFAQRLMSLRPDPDPI